MVAQEVVFSRDCTVIQIPYGNEMRIPSGTPAEITQVLGGSFTVRTDGGYLVRVSGEDAEVIGQERLKDPAAGGLRDKTREEQEQIVRSVLATVYDPEIPVDILEMGLIYNVTVSPLTAGNVEVQVEMTLTAPGCGMGQIICDDVERRVGAIAGVAGVRVDLVFDPPWTPERMSESARLKLGFF